MAISPDILGEIQAPQGGVRCTNRTRNICGTVRQRVAENLRELPNDCASHTGKGIHTEPSNMWPRPSIREISPTQHLFHSIFHLPPPQAVHDVL